MSAASGAVKTRRTQVSTRALILKAATETFIEHGFNGVSIDQIAAEAGVSKPTIYSHFESKEQLFVAIMNAICDSFETPFQDPASDSEELPVILAKIVDHYTRAVLQPGVVAMHRLFASEAERFPELSRRYYEVGPNRVHKTLAAFFKTRMERREIRDGDPMMLAQFFAALVIAPTRTRLLFAVEKRANWTMVERRNREAVTLFLKGCAI
jgi:AcrR family transcriptional regulator